MDALISINDIANIKPITPNNKQRAAQIIKEVSDLYGAKLLGASFYDWLMSQELKDVKGLMEGGTYTDCSGNLRTNPGLKTVFVYLFWMRYVYEINFVDTPTGVVAKTRTDSEQLSMGHLNNLSGQYETMAMNYFESVKGYIMANRGQYPLFCGCGPHTANLRPTIKGVKDKNIVR